MGTGVVLGIDMGGGNGNRCWVWALVSECEQGLHMDTGGWV